MLDPIQLLTTLPRGLPIVDGSATDIAYLAPNNSAVISQTNSKNEAIERKNNSRRLSVSTVAPVAENSRGVESSFLINFTHFYDLLLKIAETVYSELWQEDSVVAMNKLLQV